VSDLEEPRFPYVPLLAFACLLAALTFGLVITGKDLGFGVYTFALLAIPVALAVGFLAWYRHVLITHPTTGLGAAFAPTDDEPFEDPVEEADRLESEDEVDAAEEDLTIPTDDPEEPAEAP